MRRLIMTAGASGPPDSSPRGGRRRAAPGRPHATKTLSRLARQAVGADSGSVDPRRALRPFAEHLRHAVRTARRRQASLRLAWEPVPPPLRLVPLATALRLPAPPRAWLLDGNDSARRAARDELPLLVRKPGGRWAQVDLAVIEELADGTLRVEPSEPVPPDAELRWGGDPVQLRREAAPAAPAEVLGPAGEPARVLGARIEERDQTWVLVLEGDRRGWDRIVLDGVAHPCRPAPWPPWVEDEASGSRWSVDDDGTLQAGGARSAPAEGTELRGGDGLTYRVRAVARRGRGFRLALRLPGGGGEPDEGVDPRDRFLDALEQEVWAVPADTSGGGLRKRARRLKVLRRHPERRELTLEERPPEGSKLLLPIALDWLELQRRALRQLAEDPLPRHRTLLRLTAPPQRGGWPRLRPETPRRWFVLPEGGEGTAEQRDFVARALGAAREGDLVLLEGPPGSGKTTAIVELVLQCAERGLSVLLVSDTNSAVDNALERVLAHGAVEVDVVRVGIEERTSAPVREHLLDRRAERLAERWRREERLGPLPAEALREAARWTVAAGATVTGSTVGSLRRHPFFGGRSDGARPWERPVAGAMGWDVLIVDEASKTTFAEFLVPALLSRALVVVGDRHQLPPFLDRVELQGVLEGLVEQPEERRHPGPPLPGDHRRALHLLGALSDGGTLAEGRWLLVEPPAVCAALLGELADRSASSAGRPERSPHRWRWAWVGAEPPPPGAPAVHLPPEALAEGRLEPAVAAALWSAEAVLVEEGAIDTVAELLPGDLLPVDERLARREALHGWAFRRAAAPPPPRLARAAERLARRVGRSGWAAEVVWRLARAHELAPLRATRKRSRLREQIEARLPASSELAHVRRAVEELAAVALPSVIETLQAGAGRGAAGTALGEGLQRAEPRAFEERFVRLGWQHRMHPDVSAAPRRVVYEERALRDASTLGRRPASRAWSFLGGGRRKRFLDVRGAERDGVNEAEVRACLELLAGFGAWAAEHRCPEGRPWEVALLAFYVRQEEALRRAVADWRRKAPDRHASEVRVVVSTVDRFQGREADMVMLSMRNTNREGFLDALGRMNVALTRARELLVVVGHRPFFTGREVEGAVAALLKDAAPLSPGRRPRDAEVAR